MPAPPTPTTLATLHASTGSTTLVLVVVLIALGLAMVLTAVWLVRATRSDTPALAPLEAMGTRRWTRADAERRTAVLDGARPKGALGPAPVVPYGEATSRRARPSRPPCPNRHRWSCRTRCRQPELGRPMRRSPPREPEPMPEPDPEPAADGDSADEPEPVDDAEVADDAAAIGAGGGAGVVLTAGGYCRRMASFDVDQMLARFRDRAAAVKRRPLPPVAGEERQQFIAQAQADFQDFAIIGDAEGTIEDGVLVLRVDLRKGS